jgi:glucose/arabinose dehydrogenase
VKRSKNAVSSTIPLMASAALVLTGLFMQHAAFNGARLAAAASQNAQKPPAGPPNTSMDTDGMGALRPPDGARPHPEKVRLPAGFSISIWAENIKGPRQMALASDGTVFVGTWPVGSVYALADRDKDNRADEVMTIASGLTMPNGVAFNNGTLYVAEVNRIVKFDNILSAVKPGMAPLTPAVVYDKLPKDAFHGWKYLRYGPDGYLYFAVGAPCNVCERPDPYYGISRVKPDGTGFEVFARGVRNSVGLAFHPDTRAAWFTDNGRDALGDEVPNDELNVATKAGLNFGFPYCHEGSIVDPELGKGKSCDGYEPPAQKLGPHVAPLGLTFYTGNMFPKQYQKALFIAQHGSWNRTPAAGHNGYRIMVARTDGSKVTSYEMFAQGWLEDDKRVAWGRPVDVLQLPDGSLLVSDDRAHAIYRISYRP